MLYNTDTDILILYKSDIDVLFVLHSPLPHIIFGT